MVKFDELEKQRIYVIRSTIEEGRYGSWADCEKIYNNLSDRNRVQDSLIRVYRDLDKAEMERLTCTPEWNALREQIRQRLHNVLEPWDEPFQACQLVEGPRLANPAPVQSLSFPFEMIEDAMQVDSDNGRSTWLENYALGQSLVEVLSPRTTTGTTTTTSYGSCTSAPLCTVVPYDCTVGPYNEYANGYSDTGLDLLSLDGPSTGAVDSQAMISYGFSMPQAPLQQTVSMYDVGTSGHFDQQFSDAVQRATPIHVSGSGGSTQPPVHGTSLPTFNNFNYTDLFMDTSGATVNGSYLGPLEHVFLNGPTPGTFRGAELEQPTPDTTGEISYEQSPNFSDFPNLSAEAMGHVELISWNNAQISLSLEDLECLLKEEEPNSTRS